MDYLCNVMYIGFIMSIIIKPTGGLCNKLRFLFSHQAYANSIEKKLIVIWQADNACPGGFLDYFQPIENVTFLDNNNDNLEIEFSGCGWHPDYQMCFYKGINYYKNLILLPDLKAIIDSKIEELNNDYIAVHIRRTDHIELAKKNGNYTDDEEFFKFIDKYPDKKIYLATDNEDTQKTFLNKYGDRITFFDYITSITSKRQTSVFCSIIDLHLCINALCFLGSGYSSFSGFIEYNRKANKSTR